MRIDRHVDSACGTGRATGRAQDFPKATKEQASYQDRVDSQTCAQCTLFLPPDDCKVVQGPVSETGTCVYFTQ